MKNSVYIIGGLLVSLVAAFFLFRKKSDARGATAEEMEKVRSFKGTNNIENQKPIKTELKVAD